eukprot:763001-Hanusia_phi.AAC.5
MRLLRSGLLRPARDRVGIRFSMLLLSTERLMRDIVLLKEERDAWLTADINAEADLGVRATFCQRVRRGPKTSLQRSAAGGTSPFTWLIESFGVEGVEGSIDEEEEEEEELLSSCRCPIQREHHDSKDMITPS